MTQSILKVRVPNKKEKKKKDTLSWDKSWEIVMISAHMVCQQGSGDGLRLRSAEINLT